MLGRKYNNEVQYCSYLECPAVEHPSEVALFEVQEFLNIEAIILKCRGFKMIEWIKVVLSNLQ